MRLGLPSKRVQMPTKRVICGFPAAAIINRAMVRCQFPGRDGSMVTTRASGRTNPGTNTLLGNNVPATINASLLGWQVPLYGSWPASTNLFLNSATPATQNCTVGTGSVTITTRGGSGYTVVTSAGTATGSGFGSVSIGVPQTLTITGAGTITVTVSGTVTGATVQVEQLPIATPYIPTAGATVTHAADQHVWTPPTALSTTDGEVFTLAAPYLWSASAGAAHPSAGSARVVESTIAGLIVARAATTDALRRSDSVSSAVVDATSLTESSGAIISRSIAWKNDVVSAYRNTAQINTVFARTPPWVANASFSVGNNPGMTLPWYGFCTILKFDGGLTDIERKAFASALPASLSYAA